MPILAVFQVHIECKIVITRADKNEHLAICNTKFNECETHAGGRDTSKYLQTKDTDGTGRLYPLLCYFFLLNSNAAIILAIIDAISDTAQPNTWKVSSVLGDFFLFVLVMVYPPYISPLTELV